jgi:DNA gyrase/topoisomerase IV subunit B
MPLKGVPPSVVSKKEKILDNNEVGEIVRAVGTGVGSNFDISKLRYGKIVIVADADVDGFHISSLLILLFAVLMPELIKQGKLFICETPLYGVTKGKNFTPLWTQESLDIARQNNESITRFKGLGEFNPWQLKICALDPSNRKFIKVEYTKDLSKLIKLFSDSGEKRKLLEGKFQI